MSVWIVNSCDIFVRVIYFWKAYWSGNKTNMHFFSGSGTFYRPEWKSAQNHKNLNISWTTNAITIKRSYSITSYSITVIVLRRTNILQEISRREILYTLIFGTKWKVGFWSVKSSKIIFWDPNHVLWKIIVRYNLTEKFNLFGWENQKLEVGQ